MKTKQTIKGIEDFFSMGIESVEIHVRKKKKVAKIIQHFKYHEVNVTTHNDKYIITIR